METQKGKQQQNPQETQTKREEEGEACSDEMENEHFKYLWSSFK